MGFFFNKNKKSDQQLKEAYFTASQVELIRSRFKSNKTAMVAGWILTILILMGFFCEFLLSLEHTHSYAATAAAAACCRARDNLEEKNAARKY